MEGNFLEGSITSKDTSGKILYEARLVFSFSPGTLKYLMYLFESTGWAKQFIGDPTDQNIVLRGVTYQGLEQYRWEISENELKRSYWKPQTQFNPESPPDEVVVFQKVK